MAKTKSGITLDENEELVLEIKAELWIESSNYLDRIIGNILRSLFLLVGHKRKGYLVITNKRIIEVTEYKIFWALNIGTDIKFVMPDSIKEIGVSKEGTCCGCFCQEYRLYYKGITQRTSLLLLGEDYESALKLAKAFHRALKEIK